MKFLKTAYTLTVRFAPLAVSSIVILLMRIIWGLAFLQTGWGKLTNLPKVTAFFTDLGIPFPHLNAIAAGTTEFLGGILLLIGLGSRWAAFALTTVMIVAYATSEKESISALFQDSDPSKVMQAAPFWFLVTSLIVLACGPKIFSIDALLKRIFCKSCKQTPTLANP